MIDIYETVKKIESNLRKYSEEYNVSYEKITVTPSMICITVKGKDTAEKWYDVVMKMTGKCKIGETITYNKDKNSQTRITPCHKSYKVYGTF